MKKIYLFFSLFLLGCASGKSVLICGDHECINKKEADLYFQENMSIEVKIVELKEKKEKIYDLVKLNSGINLSNPVIKISEKETLNKEIKILTKEEIIAKKKEINKKTKVAKLTKKNKTKNKKVILDKKENNASTSLKKNIRLSEKNLESFSRLDDICKNLEKCDINEIAKYLTNLSKKKNFPDITR